MITLKDARNLRELTQLDMAKHLNIHEQSYQKYESYQVKPNVVMAHKIANYLDVDCNEIFNEQFYLK